MERWGPWTWLLLATFVMVLLDTMKIFGIIH